MQALGVHVVPVTAADIANRASLDRAIWAVARYIELDGGESAELFMEKLEEHENRHARDMAFDKLFKHSNV